MIKMPEYTGSKSKRKFETMLDLLDSCLLNGYIDLRGKSLTQEQFDLIDSTIKKDRLLTMIVSGVDSSKLTIVENKSESNLI